MQSGTENSALGRIAADFPEFKHHCLLVRSNSKNSGAEKQHDKDNHNNLKNSKADSQGFGKTFAAGVHFRDEYLRFLLGFVMMMVIMMFVIHILFSRTLFRFKFRHFFQQFKRLGISR
jgi:hypothetical protein